MLNHNGRCAIITFQSLEDRIVKKLFSKACSVNDNVKGLASLTSEQSFKLVNRKPIISSNEEILANNRAHSAKLRIIEKL